MRATEEPFRNTRGEELRRFEMCERGLAEAFRRVARRRSGEESARLQTLAAEGDGLAALLRARLAAMGVEPLPESDESWLVGDSLADAEHLAMATYHDHASD